METVSMRSANKFVACLAIVASGLLFVGAASASFSDPVGTTTQVNAAVKSSIKVKTLSTTIAATLKQYSNTSSSFDLTGPSTYGACDPYNSETLALSPKPCFFGNLKGTKTIVLVGDSNVGNWVPALGIGLAATPYRLAVFGFSSCGLANLRYTPSWGSLYERCRQWHAHIPNAIRALHPVAVIVSSGDVGLATPTKFGRTASRTSSLRQLSDRPQRSASSLAHPRSLENPPSRASRFTQIHKIVRSPTRLGTAITVRR